jgi:acyl-CoA thioesterase-2
VPNELLPHLAAVPQPDGSFLGTCIAGAGDRTYGGQVLAQALHAAGCTLDMEAIRPSSLHGHFVAPGDIRHPMRYVVRTLKESRRFVIRQVEASQDTRTLVLATFTFHAPESSEEYSAQPPPVQQPEMCPIVSMAAFGGPSPAFAPVMARLASAAGQPSTGPAPVGSPAQSLPTLQLWLRGRGDLTDDPLIHACALTWLSDLALTRTVDLPRQHLDGERKRASLNHAVWFHREVDARDWLLADHYSDSYSGARGIATARYFDRSGSLQATATQECLIRRPPATVTAGSTKQTSASPHVVTGGGLGSRGFR